MEYRAKLTIYMKFNSYNGCLIRQTRAVQTLLFCIYSQYITGQIYLVPIFPYGKRKEQIMQSKMMPLSDNCYISLFV